MNKLTAVAMAMAMAMALGASAHAEAGRPITDILTGAWTESGEDCRTNPARITFSPNRKTMTMKYASVGAATSGDIRESFTYDVLGSTDETLSVRLRGENRFDVLGNPVSWDVILITEDSFCWHRSDWQDRGCTIPRKRCDP